MGNTKLVVGSVAALVALICTEGCLSVKTEHEIKPIHITMDINLKVKQDVENYLNDAKSRSRARRPQIEALVDSGKAVECETGYLELKDTSNAADVQLVNDENADRKQSFEAIAKERGKTAEEVGRTAAKIIKLHNDERQQQKK
ncbi:MAG: DUF1318 domain-containing protein [Kiritimatiellae bacterium]|nr:DUF1318 domain-containing protein [Kiritimatiellia bacterium]